MTREEAIDCINAIHVQMFNSGNSKWTEACDMAIADMKEMDRLAKSEPVLKEPDRPHENVAKEAIKEIREMCWGYDIPSPCCPEYREHHEQMQKIIGLCDSWLKKLKEGDEK